MLPGKNVLHRRRVQWYLFNVVVTRGCLLGARAFLFVGQIVRQRWGGDAAFEPHGGCLGRRRSIPFGKEEKAYDERYAERDSDSIVLMKISFMAAL